MLKFYSIPNFFKMPNQSKEFTICSKTFTPLVIAFMRLLRFVKLAMASETYMRLLMSFIAVFVAAVLALEICMSPTICVKPSLESIIDDDKIEYTSIFIIFLNSLIEH